MRAQFTPRFERDFYKRVFNPGPISPYSPDGLPCHIWRGAVNGRTGYGKVKHMDRNFLVHRAAWELANGPIPPGELVRHKCHVRTCVNPAHLELGSYADNAQDRSRAGRWPIAGTPQPRLEPVVPRWNSKRPLSEKFWEYVDMSGGTTACWRWTGMIRTRPPVGGYGVLANKGRLVMAHRVSWELHNGPIPEGLLVLHKCDGGGNRWCVNPLHLSLGTHKENADDKRRVGRHLGGGKWAKEHPVEAAAGLRAWYDADPSRRKRGDTHYLHINPSRALRGEAHGATKATEATVREILRLFGEGVTQYRLSKNFGISLSQVHRIVHRRSWKHLDT